MTTTDPPRGLSPTTDFSWNRTKCTRVAVLGDTIDDVLSRRKTLVLFNYEGSDRLYERISRFFRFRNVEVERGFTDPGRPRNYAVLYDDAGIYATSSVNDLRARLPETVEYRDAMADSCGLHRPGVLAELDGTVFTITAEGVDLLWHLVADIERLAASTGDGRLLTNDGRFDGVRDADYGAVGARERYRRLDRSGIKVHVYGHLTVDPDDLRITVHPTESSELAETWVVAYDGGGRPARRAAVVAEARPDGYYGFWTFDSALVETVVEYLSATYPEADCP